MRNIGSIQSPVQVDDCWSSNFYLTWIEAVITEKPTRVNPKVIIEERDKIEEEEEGSRHRIRN